MKSWERAMLYSLFAGMVFLVTTGFGLLKIEGKDTLRVQALQIVDQDGEPQIVMGQLGTRISNADGDSDGYVVSNRTDETGGGFIYIQGKKGSTQVWLSASKRGGRVGIATASDRNVGSLGAVDDEGELELRGPGIGAKSKMAIYGHKGKGKVVPHPAS